MAKIADFGVSKLLDSLSKNSSANRNRFSIKGSVYWMAPEIVRQAQPSTKVDIWSLGCLILEMISGKHPWAGLDQVQAMYHVRS